MDNAIAVKVLANSALDDSAKVMLLVLLEIYGTKRFTLMGIEKQFDNDSEILSNYLKLADSLGILNSSAEGYAFDLRNWGEPLKSVTLRPVEYYDYDLYKEKESLSKEMVGVGVVLDYIKSKVKGYKVNKNEKTAASILTNNYPKAVIFKAIDNFIRLAPVKGLGAVNLVNIQKNMKELM